MIQPLAPKKDLCGTHCIGDWMGRDSLEVGVMRKDCSCCWKLNPDCLPGSQSLYWLSIPGSLVALIFCCICSLQIGTGFSDEDLQKHTEFFKEHLITQPRPYYRYDSQHEPDHWFDAVQVWEIKCADLSLSPVHRAAIGIVSMNIQYL